MPQKKEDVNMDFVDYTAVLEESKMVLRQCFQQFQLDEVFLAFNGGKDCTALLDITINILREIYRRENIAKDLKIIYIRASSPFKELEEFVKEVELQYDTRLIVVEGEMKSTLQRIMDEDVKLKACLMGTRRTDPYSLDMKFMQKTDANWPQILRVSPLLNWTYHQIWSYMLERRVPYCNLYNKGYTSIGSTLNTWPNPALAYKDQSGCLSYYPAWHLTDASLERAGRGYPSKPTANGHAVSNGHENCINIDNPSDDQIS